MDLAPVEQNGSAFGFGCLGRKPAGECHSLLQLLQCIRHIHPAALELKRSRNELPAGPEHEENEVASLSRPAMGIEGLVRINDDALTWNIFEGNPASVPRAGITTVLGAYVRADGVKKFPHSRVPPTLASASRFCNSAERL